MDRDERRVRDKVAIGRKQGAREVKSLLDIRADGSLLEGAAHRLRDAHEAVREEREEDRVRRVVLWLLRHGAQTLAGVPACGGCSRRSGRDTCYPSADEMRGTAIGVTLAVGAGVSDRRSARSCHERLRLVFVARSEFSGAPWLGNADRDRRNSELDIEGSVREEHDGGSHMQRRRGAR